LNEAPLWTKIPHYEDGELPEYLFRRGRFEHLKRLRAHKLRAVQSKY